MSARKPPSEPKPPNVEVDAMDEKEWEHGQHTPEVGTDALTALVKESATRTPAAGVPTSSGRPTAKTVKRAGTKNEKSGGKRKPTAPGRTKRARTKPGAVAHGTSADVPNQDDIPTKPVPKLDPADTADALAPEPSPAELTSTLTPADSGPARASLETSASSRAATPSSPPATAPRPATATKPPPLPAQARTKTASIAPDATSGANQSASSSSSPSDGTVSGSGATSSSTGTRSGSTTLSPTAFIRSSKDTVNPPTSLSEKVMAPRTSRSTATPMLPLPRAAAAIALGTIPIEADPSDPSSITGIPATNADDEDSSVLAAYLSVPVGEERRARKATLPPPPPREFPIEAEEVLTALPAPSRSSKSLLSAKNLAIAGIAGAVLIGALVVVLGGDDDTKPVARTVTESPTEETLPVAKEPEGSDPRAVVPGVTSGSGERGTDEAEIEIEIAGTGSASAATATTTTATASATATVTTIATPAIATATAPPITTTTTATAVTPDPTTAQPKVSKFREQLDTLLKNKEIVLEYDGRIGKNSAPPSDQPAIAKARASYVTGTQRLNAGDHSGALDNYRRALSQYPAYVGAYRGMGLAYERKGDKSNALKALRMYVSVAPRATDVAALRKRIESLSK